MATPRIAVLFFSLLTLLPSAATCEEHDRADVAAWVAKLEGRDESEVLLAAGELGRLGPAAIDAAPALLKAMSSRSANDKPWWILRGALVAIGPDAVPMLVERIESGEAVVRRTALSVLGELGPGAAGAVRVLVSALQDAGVRADAAHALGGIGEAAVEAVPALAEGLKAGDAEFRAACAGALAGIGPKARDASPALRAALADIEPDVRSAAARALGALGATDAVAELIALARSDDQDVRSSAIAALGDLGPPAAEAVDVLIPLLDREELNSLVRDTLPKFGEAGIAAMLTGLGHPSEYVRRGLVDALGQARPVTPRVVEALALALRRDPSWRVRQEAAFRLGWMRPESDVAIPALIEAAGEEHSYVCWRAVEALGRFGNAARCAFPALVRAMASEDGSVRGDAAASMEAIGAPDPAGLPSLIELLQDASPTVRAWAAWSIGLLGGDGRDALPALKKASHDMDAEASRWAQDALARIREAGR